MWCLKCNNNLSECVCEDLKERLEALSNCPILHPSVLVKIKLDIEQKKNRPDVKPEDN